LVPSQRVGLVLCAVLGKSMCLRRVEASDDVAMWVIFLLVGVSLENLLTRMQGAARRTALRHHVIWAAQTHGVSASQVHVPRGAKFRQRTSLLGRSTSLSVVMRHHLSEELSSVNRPRTNTSQLSPNMTRRSASMMRIVPSALYVIRGPTGDVPALFL